MDPIKEQYQDASNLDARIAIHSRFGTAKTNWYRWLFEHFALPEGARVLELGCGPARLWRENVARVPESWRVTLTDLSAGMVAEAKHHLKSFGKTFAFRVADAQNLPFGDGSFDAVIANHMLYHMPDLSAALAEIKRVLEPGGRFFAATNGDKHMRELDELSEGIVPVGAVSAFTGSFHATDFTLEAAPGLLEPYFSAVKLHQPEGDPDLHVTEVEPIVAYILSTVPSNARRDEGRVAALRQRVAERLSHTGEIRITRATGLLEARR